MIKAVFFDMDGTLSVPRYYTNGKFVTGFTDEGWFNHCNTLRERAYDYCMVVKPVERYARTYIKSNIPLYILSVAQTEGERLAKLEFISAHFPGIFNDVFFVESNPGKITVMNEYCDKNNLEHAEAEIVEDTYSVVLMANDNGYKATHISYIICDL